jgi:peptidoglycan/xylan/chitin deacetylase (PgdA/CDA1 family)
MSVVARLTAAARRMTGRIDPVILMYHRVASPQVDPWGLAVTPERFAGHMRVICDRRQPVTLGWLASELSAGRRPSRVVAVTFDDGYRDVLLNAKPVLDRLGVPATMFIATDKLGSESGFWWDELASIVFRSALPAACPDPSFIPADESALLQEAFSRRSAVDVHLSLWRSMRRLTPPARKAALEELSAALLMAPSSDAAVMTPAEVLELCAGGTFAIGAHTRSHPSLPMLTTGEQREEMAGSREYLEKLLQTPVESLAYPFGDFDATTEAIARSAGFRCATSVLGGAANEASMLWRLPRLDVKDWTEDEFRRRLEWFI